TRRTMIFSSHPGCGMVAPSSATMRCVTAARSSMLVLGGSGLVGSSVVRLWDDSVELDVPTHTQLDVLDGEALRAFVRHTEAPVVLNLAAWADVDGAEAEQGNQDGRVYALNARLPGQLATVCAELGKYLVHVSTDYVFDGKAERPYVERDQTAPLCWYA